MKKNIPVILFLVATLTLGSLFILPMWKIALIAPQYPTGVEMLIWINKLGGKEPGTLQNINILNHYVGMKPIEPDSIPELKFFPWVILGMMGLGLIIAFTRSAKLYLTWTVVFSLLCMAGLYDFYLWEYDYGHNLSANAPMKFEDTYYQPPLIGSKTILNFTAQSYPATGGYLIGLSILLAFTAWWLLRKNKKNEAAITDTKHAHSSSGVFG